MGLRLAIHVGHDSNVAVVDEQGQVLLAIGEERLNRIKMYPGFPKLALQLALDRYQKDITGIYAIRLPRHLRLLRELAFQLNSRKKGLSAPSFSSLLRRYAGRLRSRTLETEGGEQLTLLRGKEPVSIEHHLAHAASAFYQSGFDQALIMTLDGEGDGYSAGFYRGSSRGIQRTHSFFFNEVTIGRDYEKVTAMLGFHPLRHPGKVTGLAAFAEPDERCIAALDEYLAGTWKVQPDEAYFTQHSYQVITDEGRQDLMRVRKNLFPEFSNAQLASAIQTITERRVLDMIRSVRRPEDTAIALAGGVFANVKLNKRIKELGFNQIFIQPAMSDQGLALGAILYDLGQQHLIRPTPVNNVFYGLEYSQDEIRSAIELAGLVAAVPDDPVDSVVQRLTQGKVVALFHGKMEFGPRALGHRSILYHTSDPTVNDWLNKQLKRTEFMPFAPVTLTNQAAACYHGIDGAEHPARFMTITFDCTEQMKRQSPAVVHVDGTARPQLIDDGDTPVYVEILKRYFKLTGIPSLVNTSFNMHEEPIVCSPNDAIRAFQKSELDAMLIGDFLLERKSGGRSL